MPQNLDVLRGKNYDLNKICCLRDYQQVNEMYLNYWYGKNKLWEERNSELCIGNKRALMFHQPAKSLK